MVEIELVIHKPKRTFEITAKGHAESGESGRDLVCASASILANTLAANVISMHERKVFASKPKMHIASGDVDIKVKAKKDDLSYEEVYNTFRIIWEGFRLLAVGFPQYISIKSIETDE